MSSAPENANEGCVGPASSNAGKATSCDGCPNQADCASGAHRNGNAANLDTVADRLSMVKHKILVMSGKGGVGKSTFACQLAFALAEQGKSVGLLDIDICGPSAPRMLGLQGHEVHQSASGWSPVYINDSLGVMSIGFMLPNPDDAVIWRGPRKNGLIKSFLTEVNWGPLDYLIIDTPPGTSDEHISMVQFLRATDVDGAIVVTTPQEVSMADVRKELNFCKKSQLNVLGVVENMAGLAVPASGLAFRDAQGNDVTSAVQEAIRSCGPGLVATTEVFRPHGPAGAAQMAEDFEVPYLGAVPLDPSMAAACEQGMSFLETNPGAPAAPAFRDVLQRVLAATPDLA